MKCLLNWVEIWWLTLPLQNIPLLSFKKAYSPTSWRVFFTCVDVVKGVFFTMEVILRLSTTYVFNGRPGLFEFPKLTNALFFFFSECTKLLIWPLLTFLLSLVDFFFVLASGWSASPPLTAALLCVQYNSIQMHLESTPDLLLAQWQVNEGRAHAALLFICSLRVSCPITFGPFKKSQPCIKEL